MKSDAPVVLVGGTGFIGRHICEAFHLRGIAAASVSYAPDLQFLSRFAPSIAAYEAMSSDAWRVLADAEVVIYLAHRSRPSSHLGESYVEIESNVVESVRFVEELVGINPSVQLIYASSGGQVYGRRASATPALETEDPQPCTPYGLGKHLVEQSLLYLARVHGISLAVLRMANPVGRWQLRGTHGFVSAAVRAVCARSPLVIYGTGENRRDYFDADDLGAFVCDLCGDPSRRGTGVFNIGSGVGHTENEVLGMIQQVLGSRVSVEFRAARDFDLPYAVLNVTKAEAELGWRPTTSLPSTIRKLEAAMQDPLVGAR